RPPAGAAVEGHALVRRDAGLVPVGGDLGVRPHGVVDAAVVLHVVGVAAAVAPDVAGDPSGGTDVVVATHRADVLAPGPDGHERRPVRVGDPLLGLVDVADQVGADGDRRAECRHGHRLPVDRLERVTLADPAVVAPVEDPDVVDTRVAEDQGRPG